jgi:Lipoprotein LpqB beta-propeller domain/Sporulation and spore germination
VLSRLTRALAKPALLGLLLVAALAGCVSMPSGGAVSSYPVTQGPAGQGRSFIQLIAQPPGQNWTPLQIVRGFLIASASIGDRLKTAREYLTPEADRDWKPDWSADVYSGKGPSATGPAPRKGQKTATVTVSGKVVAQLSGGGGYAVPSASTPGLQSTSPTTVTFQVTLVGGQWRISDPPPALLLNSGSFQADYQLRNLYFFDPTGHNLVPDPIYVPLQATPAELMDELVGDLITPPMDDWLTSGATVSAFPRGTHLIGDVTLEPETAAVNLRGAITKASKTVLEQVSAQLLSTLSGSGANGPSVQQVELSLDGKPWSQAHNNPVQSKSTIKYLPPTGATDWFYYIDHAGYLEERNGPGSPATRITFIGYGYTPTDTQIAVSPDRRYVAVLRNTTLYTGLIGAPPPMLEPRGSGYTSVSWDANDDLWATTANQIVMLRGDTGPGQKWSSVTVSVVNFQGIVTSGPFTAIRVAPDGVRVAVIDDGVELNFGAIVVKPGPRPTAKIQFSPFYVAPPDTTFTALTWYGPDNVITLSSPGPQVTEYPVNGSGSTNLQAEPGMQSISASYNSALIAALPNGVMTAAPSLTGTWGNIVNGYGVSPVYPG